MPARPIASVLLLALLAPAYGWIDRGHMVIAAIARHHLTAKARAEADRLLAIGAEPRTADLLTAACWADDVRRDRPETGPWHYINFHFRADGKPDANKPEAENVVWAIRKFEAVLKDRSKPDAERAEALRFVLHFVGDIHQPLHATAEDTDSHPDGDRGGNLFRIQSPAAYANMSRPPSNLHFLWDLGAGLFEGTSRDFRPLQPAGLKEIEDQAAAIERAQPRSSLRSASNPDPQTWAEESFEAAKAVVYSLPEGSQPTAEYMAKGRALAERRVALAGYRLADSLNRILG